MASFAVVTGLAALATMAGCQESKALSRSTALDLLRKREAPPVTYHTDAMMWCRMLDTMPGHTNADWLPLMHAGLMQVVDSAPLPMQTEHRCFLTFTPAGRQRLGTLFARRWDFRVFDDPALLGRGPEQHDDWIISAARKTVREITGVTQAEHAVTAVAEFRWGLDPTKAAPYLVDQNGQPVVPSVTSGTGRAMFQRYDDGWRLVAVHY